jgi:hypothetical protein
MAGASPRLKARYWPHFAATMSAGSQLHGGLEGLLGCLVVLLSPRPGGRDDGRFAWRDMRAGQPLQKGLRGLVALCRLERHVQERDVGRGEGAAWFRRRGREQDGEVGTVGEPLLAEGIEGLYHLRGGAGHGQAEGVVELGHEASLAQGCGQQKTPGARLPGFVSADAAAGYSRLAKRRRSIRKRLMKSMYRRSAPRMAFLPDVALSSPSKYISLICCVS